MLLFREKCSVSEKNIGYIESKIKKEFVTFEKTIDPTNMNGMHAKIKNDNVQEYASENITQLKNVAIRYATMAILSSTCSFNVSKLLRIFNLK